MAGMFYIKRLIGMPGDTIRIYADSTKEIEIKEKDSENFEKFTVLFPEFGKVMYSGKGGYAGYALGDRPDRETDNYHEYHVPEGEYFMMGDNSFNSRDSRSFGSVRRRDLIGTALGVFLAFQ